MKITLLLLPRTHPFRIYAVDRAETMAELSCAAAAIRQPGKSLPVYLNVILAYLLLDSLSPWVKGPTDLFEWYKIDDRVMILQRVEELLGQRAPLLTKLFDLL